MRIMPVAPYPHLVLLAPLHVKPASALLVVACRPDIAAIINYPRTSSFLSLLPLSFLFLSVPPSLSLSPIAAITQHYCTPSFPLPPPTPLPLPPSPSPIAAIAHHRHTPSLRRARLPGAHGVV